VVFHLLQQPLLLERRHHRGASLEAVHPAERSRHGVAHGGRGGHYVHRGDAVPLRDLEVVGVVRRGDLHRAAAELRVRVLVADHGDAAAGERQLHLAAQERGVPRVVRMHRDGGVAEHGLRTRGGDHQVRPAVVQARQAGGVGAGGDGVAQMPEFAVRLLRLRLLVGERGEAARAPVDDAVAAVDEPLLVQTHEHLAHRRGELRVQREAGARPVRRRPDGAELPQDGAARLADELPHAFDEGLAAQVVARLSLAREQALDHVLRGDAGVVGAGEPERLAPLHPPPADEHVLHRVVEAVPHVQHRRHVGRRDDDHVRIAPRVRVRAEVSLRLPTGVERVLGLARIVLRRQRLGHPGLPTKTGRRRAPLVVLVNREV
jgi:hypothetical protein